MNVTKTMMGERAEITTTDGCVYEGVFHVLTPADDPRPGGKRGMYRVRFFIYIFRVCAFFFDLPDVGARGSLKQGDFDDSCFLNRVPGGVTECALHYSLSASS